jgi:hypothetical protein
MFLVNVIENAGKKADGTYPIYTDALKSACYEQAYLQGRITEDTLLNAKFAIMPKITEILLADIKKYKEETQPTKEMLYRISFMGEKQLKEIIEIFKDELIKSLGTENQQYGQAVTEQIANISSFHGWQDGLRLRKNAVKLPHNFFSALNDDLYQFTENRRLTAMAER